MTLYAHRHSRAEQLVAQLADELRASWPPDPFARIRLVVGSRGMERWLRAELATRHRSLAGVDFWFPGRAFDAAMDAIFERSAASDGVLTPPQAPAASGLHPLKVCEVLRRRMAEPAFARVRRYLGEASGAIGAREFAFAREVTAVLERLHYDRPDQVLAWLDDPTRLDPEAGDDAPWLAAVLKDLGSIEEGPAQRLARLRALPPSGVHPPLFLFGLSSLRAGDRQRVQALSTHLDIHLFSLVPSMQWWADLRSRGEVRRAYARATTPAARAQLLEQLQRDNPFLVAHGAPSRDLQLWLEDVGYEARDEEVDEPTPPRTRLAALQRFIDDAREASALHEPPFDAPFDDEAPGALPSVEVHACHGALRQCEALREELLRRFAADPTLEPRQVLVMTPDLATFAPLIAAVFARTGGDAPSLPVHIADLGLRDTNPVAAVLLDLVALVGERISASALLAFLAHEPVRHRFSLQDVDLAAFRELVASSGLRWAWDADDRAAHDQPALDQNTVRFALERLALGSLMPDPGGIDALPAAAGFGPAAPVDVATRDQGERFGVFAHLCEILRHELCRFAAPASPGIWRTRLVEAMDALAGVPEERAWQRQQVVAALAELLPDAPALPAGEAAAVASLPLLDATALQVLLTDAFTLPRSGDRPTTGAITVSSMEPMRSVPFRIIAMVGMDDGAFPRAARPRAWDPFARPQPGEHDRRTLDRHLFLESLLCARDALLVFGRGFESARGRAQPLSVVVEELRERLPPALVRVQPLQPWSLRAFAEPARLPLDASQIDAARARLSPPRQSGLAATRADAPWPDVRARPGGVLSVRALARTLENAPAALLEHTLGLRLSRREADVGDREPLEVSELDAWQIRRQLLEAGQGRGDAPMLAEVVARHRALGWLPLEAGGEVLLEKELGAVREIFARSRALGGERLTASASASVCVQSSANAPTVMLRGDPPEVRRHEQGHASHVWLTPSHAPGDRQLLEAWCTLLVAVASGQPVREAHLVAQGRAHRLVAPAPAQASAWLDEAVALWWRAQAGPLLLVPVFSRALAEGAHKDPEAAPEAVLAQHLDRFFAPDHARARGALSDEATEALFGGLDEADLVARAPEWVGLARAVWSPVLSSLEHP